MEFNLNLREHDETNVLIHNLQYYRPFRAEAVFIGIATHNIRAFLKTFVRPEKTVIGMQTPPVTMHEKSSIKSDTYIGVATSGAISEQTKVSGTPVHIGVQTPNPVLVRKLQTYPGKIVVGVMTNEAEISEKQSISGPPTLIGVATKSAGIHQVKHVYLNETIGVATNGAISERTVVAPIKQYIGVRCSRPEMMTGHYRTLEEVDAFGTLESLDDIALADIDYFEV